MSTPVGSGAADATPTTGGSVPFAASGYAGAAEVDEAPDAKQGRVHVPGEVPTTVVLEGPAEMQVGGSSSKPAKK